MKATITIADVPGTNSEVNIEVDFGEDGLSELNKNSPAHSLAVDMLRFATYQIVGPEAAELMAARMRGDVQ